jgi:hypothetical protein
LKKLSCIKQISDKKGLPNNWDIKTLENLKNIKKEFQSIHLMEYTKAKNIIIKTNFPDIGLRHEKKYFIYTSLFSSLFDTFLNNKIEQMINRAFELWQIEDYKDIIDFNIDEIYKRSFVREDWFNPPAVYPIIEEVSKEELQKVLTEIPWPYEEANGDKKEEIIKDEFLDKLVNIVISKRLNCTEDQVRKEISEKIIERLYYTSSGRIFTVVFYQHLRKQKMYDRICRHFYEDDFLVGKGSQDAKNFVDRLEQHIQNVNEAFFHTPANEEPQSAEKLQAVIDELDSLYKEWYEKCKKM